MTISAYVGLPGHGKSYSVVQHVIFPALESGRTVFSNIPMNHDECFKRTGNKIIPFETDDILENSNWWTDIFIAGSIIVIDEVWRLWPAGIPAQKARIEDKTFINEHRHMVADGFSTEVVLVTQDLSDISNFARNKVDTTFRVVKLTKIGSKKKYRLDVYDGSVTGQSPPKAKRSRQIFGQYKPEIFKLYISQTRGDGTYGDESRTDNRFNVLKGIAFKVIPVAIVVLGFLAFQGGSKVKTHYTDPELLPQPVNSNPDVSTKLTNPPQKNFFLDEIDKIYIASNNEILGPRFLIESEGSQAVIDVYVLAQLGIEIKNLSECFVLFYSNKKPVGKAFCMPDSSNSFIDRLKENPIKVGQI